MRITAGWLSPIQPDADTIDGFREAGESLLGGLQLAFGGSSILTPRHSFFESAGVISAPWLGILEERIKNSIRDQGASLEEEEALLEKPVAEQAIRFFQATSDILPGEPYIYSSDRGDLIAEHRSPLGHLTNIIGESFLLTFAVVDGKPIQKTFDIAQCDFQEARRELSKLSKRIRVDSYGKTVGSK